MHSWPLLGGDRTARDIILLGAPGAGKGTQAEVLTERLGLTHLSTGNILRAAVAAGTKLGGQAKSYMDRGDLVPDDLIVEMVAERLWEEDCARGVLFDGFPRTLPQAEALSRVMEGTGRGEPTALALEVAEEDLVRRLAGRRTCRAGAHVFHVDRLPPGATACPECGGELYQREDDAPEPIRQRLRVYAEQTEPLLEYYRQRGRLVAVEGAGSPEEVSGRALAALAEALG